ncbi:MAG: hypothetical protein JWL81_2312 [Verrucomicrobiales bacterium]|nr:hypothetical protein [Verrucomicrobiales bacterium]
MAGAALTGARDFPVLGKEVAGGGELGAEALSRGGAGGGNQGGRGFSRDVQRACEGLVQKRVGCRGARLAEGMARGNGEGPSKAKVFSMMDQAASCPATDHGFPGQEGGQGFGGLLKITKRQGGAVPAVKAEDRGFCLRSVAEKGLVDGHIFRAGAGGWSVVPDEQIGKHCSEADILSTKLIVTVLRNTWQCGGGVKPRRLEGGAIESDPRDFGSSGYPSHRDSPKFPEKLLPFI